MGEQEQLEHQFAENKQLIGNIDRIEKLHTIIDSRLSVITKSAEAIQEAINRLSSIDTCGELDHTISMLKTELEDYKGEVEQIKIDDELSQLMRLLGVTQEHLIEAQREDILEGMMVVSNE